MKESGKMCKLKQCSKHNQLKNIEVKLIKEVKDHCNENFKT